jgi:branched-chain amino acid transport system ATP-binding protein
MEGTVSVPLLACKGLSVRFGGLVALNALDLEVRRDEVLGLIGPNGSGKTTFFNVLTGVVPAAAGEARFEGQDLTQLAPQRIYAAGVTRTFQRSRLALPLSVFDNLMIGNHRQLEHGLVFNLFRRAALKRELEENLGKATALVATFSARLAGRMFEAVGAFSMIDRRRIEICRALVSEPRLLLLDEPSAGMTHEETRELMDDILAVRARLAGLTVVVIEHEMKVIERVTQRCVVLNYGRKISEGAYAEVAADAQVQEAYLGTQ